MIAFPTQLPILLLWTALSAPASTVAQPARSEVLVAQAAPAPKAPAPKAAKKPAAKSAEAPAPKAAEKSPAEAAKPAAKSPAGKVSAAARPLVDKLQGFYEGTRDFTADFQQTYRYEALRRESKSSGKVAFKKPGLMRWDYAEPREKAFIVDGKDLWVWTPEDHTAVRRRGFTADGLSTSITFLWGKGRLEDEFSIELEGDDRLVLTPLSPQGGFQRVEFKVDRSTGRVIESVVTDPQGNTNHMRFENVKLNTAVSPERFAFTPPAGADVQEMTGAGLH